MMSAPFRLPQAFASAPPNTTPSPQFFGLPPGACVFCVRVCTQCKKAQVPPSCFVVVCVQAAQAAWHRPLSVTSCYYFYSWQSACQHPAPHSPRFGEPDFPSFFSCNAFPTPRSNQCQALDKLPPSPTPHPHCRILYPLVPHSLSTGHTSTTRHPPSLAFILSFTALFRC